MLWFHEGTAVCPGRKARLGRGARGRRRQLARFGPGGRKRRRGGRRRRHRNARRRWRGRDVHSKCGCRSGSITSGLSIYRLPHGSGVRSCGARRERLAGCPDRGCGAQIHRPGRRWSHRSKRERRCFAGSRGGLDGRVLRCAAAGGGPHGSRRFFGSGIVWRRRRFDAGPILWRLVNRLARRAGNCRQTGAGVSSFLGSAWPRCQAMVIRFRQSGVSG